MDEKKLTLEEKLNIIKNCTDEDIETLNSGQIMIVERIKEGAQVREIIEMLGCSRQNAHARIERVAYKILNKDAEKSEKKPISKKEKKPRQFEKFDFGKFSDFSVLSAREKEVVSIHMQNSALTHREIGEILGTTAKTVGVLLWNSKKKLLGDWEDKRKYNAEYRKEYHKKNRDRCIAWSKEYYEKNKERLLENKKNYAKEYYQKNRDRLKEEQRAYEIKKGNRMRPIGSIDRCAFCGSEYTVVAGRQKYCSESCRRKGASERKMEYDNASGQKSKEGGSDDN